MKRTAASVRHRPPIPLPARHRGFSPTSSVPAPPPACAAAERSEDGPRATGRSVSNVSSNIHFPGNGQRRGSGPRGPVWELRFARDVRDGKGLRFKVAAQPSPLIVRGVAWSRERPRERVSDGSGQCHCRRLLGGSPFPRARRSRHLASRGEKSVGGGDGVGAPGRPLSLPALRTSASHRYGAEGDAYSQLHFAGRRRLSVSVGSRGPRLSERRAARRPVWGHGSPAPAPKQGAPVLPPPPTPPGGHWLLTDRHTVRTAASLSNGQRVCVCRTWTWLGSDTGLPRIPQRSLQKGPG